MKSWLLKTIVNAKSLFTDKLWTLNTTNSRPAWKRTVRFVKIVRITFGTFAENRMGFQCVALSYFCMLAIVPLVAFIFAVSGGLGLEGRFSNLLYSLIPNYQDLINILLEKASNIIDAAQSGWVGFFGALTFLWAIIWMMFQVERVFNNVWGIRKIPRKLYKRFSYYFLVLFLIPFIILTFGTGLLYYSNATKLIGLDLGDLRFLPKFLTLLGIYTICVFTFSLMYRSIPATSVKYRYALKASVVSALVFVIFQYLYMETQVFVSRLNGVYGALAAIPLFMIWMNFSWQIIIYGAELTYSFQNVDTYHLPE